ncbi:MAG TPA: DUF3800 domain-containing protein [Alloacidobacterium sp.]|nr:DUF3800 domain-containing protein [Alloacidobacterium sp.]
MTNQTPLQNDNGLERGCAVSIARSYIGSFCPRSNVHESEVFVAVRVHLDSSGKPDRPFVTLAAFMAADSTWKIFEDGWNAVLKSGPIPVDHMHMSHAVHKQIKSPWSPVRGWNDTLVWDLIFKLVRFIDQFDISDFLVFSCVVDMNAIRKLRSEGLQVPSEIFFCNKYVSEHLITALGRAILRDHPRQEVIGLRREDLAHFVFDRDEYFYQPFRNEWNRETHMAEESNKFSYWQLVDSITEGHMRFTPGIQAADMMAWSINRENVAQVGQYGTGLATIIRNITAGASMTCDEAFIRRFLERENERAEAIRSGDEYHPPSRSKSGENCDGSGEAG